MKNETKSIGKFNIEIAIHRNTFSVHMVPSEAYAG